MLSCTCTAITLELSALVFHVTTESHTEEDVSAAGEYLKCERAVLEPGFGAHGPRQDTWSVYL